MIVKSVRVERFRSILDETLECEQLTVMVGPNGVGKSCFLRAMDLFYDPSPSVDPEDFYNRDSSYELVISLTFSVKTATARELFNKYIEGNELTVARVFKFVDEKISTRYHGSSLQSLHFDEVRKAMTLKERARVAKQRYEELRSKDEFTSLPAWTVLGAVEESLQSWELANPEECVRKRDDGQFFGFGGVGRGYLDRLCPFDEPHLRAGGVTRHHASNLEVSHGCIGEEYHGPDLA